MLIVSIFKTPWGSLEVGHDEQHIHQALFVNKPPSSTKSPFCKLIQTELDCYLQNAKHRFQLPLKPKGSGFQQSVWGALLVIPSGRTLTYGELALQLQTSPRAIGQACKTNPITLFIPCHRIVAKIDIGGYMGQEKAINYKMGLLNHEGSFL
ncbi:methylated DNA protein cysteine S- methyltransferase [Legionella adelaidensis]|uniref:Methylated DNA protein cysteine S-methyltransferase n=1 Tax=Legionella adelaidensis TaxID=45056 RepID=A0A0W0R2L4_9GAMM|nr:methylated-DNA--[protein]-cysteine S-methyltransferase [Legionella adelaidensis]KTC65274.1 methylated DNA protein cysteine S- methyltransferase [Legionella adelaidensis]